MPKFPKSQADVFTLGHLMLMGYFEHAADFPSIDMSVFASTLSEYVSSLTQENGARAAVQSATEAKNEKLQILKKVMKDCLRKSEVDVTDSPEKLYYRAKRTYRSRDR